MMTSISIEIVGVDPHHVKGPLALGFGKTLSLFSKALLIPDTTP